ncbi:hypothetical protein A4A49_14671 [Nicotiana attenuata]|uniref:Uncharacterized protein n=1 Tax=Nicotiana attenuata TaxID=49451 RepID=A0A1J6I1T8_NICAT|nr:hypothetical protein A4A49_14671 [Nicotiana attenuata]
MRDFLLNLLFFIKLDCVFCMNLELIFLFEFLLTCDSYPSPCWRQIITAAFSTDPTSRLHVLQRLANSIITVYFILLASLSAFANHFESTFDNLEALTRR